MAKLLWSVVQFFRDCIESLTEDDKATASRAYEARLAQKRWHDFLAS
jgi:hypothetical protein